MPTTDREKQCAFLEALETYMVAILRQALMPSDFDESRTRQARENVVDVLAKLTEGK